MKYLLLNMILFVGSTMVQGQQNLDSLVTLLPELSGKERAETILQLAVGYSKTDSSKSIIYADETYQIGQAIGDSTLMGLALFNKAECYYYFDQYDSALANYDQAIRLFINLDDSVNIGETLNSIGLVHYFEGNYNEAVEKLFEALSFYKNPRHLSNAAHIYSNLGMVFSRIGNYPKAAENYKQAARINSEIKEFSSLAVNYNGIGVAFYNQEQYDSSKVYYNKALTLFKQLKNRQREAIVLNNIANIYLNTGDSLEFALKFYQQAIQVFEELGDLRSKAFVLEGLGGVYRELEDYKNAVASIRESLKLAEENDYGYYIQQLNYQDLSLTYEKMGLINEAFDAYKLHSLYKDSLLQEERLDQVAELEKKYQTQQKEAEIERLNASRQIDLLQIKRDKELRAFGIIAILLLVTAIFFVSVAYLNKNRLNEILNRKNKKIEEQRKELEKVNASKNKFFSIIAHDLKNPFHTVMGYSYLLNKEYSHLSESEKKRYAEDIYKSASSIFRLLQNLLDWSRAQTGSLKYTPQELNFRDIYKSIESLLKPVAEQKQIALITEMPEDTHVYADPMMLETVMRNLLTNAIKFTNENGWIKTVVKKEEDKVTVCIEDNGVGIDNTDVNKLFQIDSKVKRKGTNLEDGSGLGLIICNEFVQQNGGDIWVDSQNGKGSRFYFTIPRS